MARPLRADNQSTNGPAYYYTKAGRLEYRYWVRPTQTGVTNRIQTAYTYNNAGDLATVAYNDVTPGTPGTTYTYDRRGRQWTVVRNSVTTTLTYTDANQLLTESYAGGTLAGLSVNRTLDIKLRLETANIKNGGTVLQSATYGYDTASRLLTVTDGSYSATHAYHPNSSLVSTLTFTNTGAGGMRTARAYDKLNRLSSISSVAYGSSAPTLPVRYDYQYNRANQRTRADLADGSYWIYQYDALGQVVSGRRYWADGTPVSGQQFDYAFDDIGNRDTTGGRVSAVSDYTANRLNQHTQRTNAPYVDVMGIANPTAGVTVNGNTATRRGEYFHYALNVPNSTAQYQTVTVVSQYGAGQTETGKAYVPPATESFGYDADGNLTSDGRWTYTWDGENRLVQMIRDTDTPSGARQKLVFEYDWQGRRIRKQCYTYSGGWLEQTDTICLYHDWNLMGELNANASNAKVRTYVWGTDLSGSMTGAGGVGGLLVVTDHSSPVTHHFVAFDGNGNVAGLVDTSNGSLSARYDYGPFGESVRATGPMADLNPIRFSTKYTDPESGLLYYGYRYYNPSTGRWLSRDPVGERGGLNLHGFVDNAPIVQSDARGQSIGSLSQWQAGLRASRIEFWNRLRSWCPEKAIVWTTRSGKSTQCCTREACLAQAEGLSRILAAHYEIVFTSEYLRFGDILWGGLAANQRADRAPHHGAIAADFDQGYGLKCIGWQDLTLKVFSEVMFPWRGQRQQCFKGAKLFKADNPVEIKHAWFGVYSPGNPDPEDVDIHVDPWWSAGRDIIQDFPSRPARIDPIMW